MKTIISQLIHHFHEATLAAYPSLSSSEELPIDITQAVQEQFGHYQCNTAMKLTKQLKQNPRQIAEAIVNHLSSDAKSIMVKQEIAGPGFINITLNPQFLTAYVEAMVSDPHLGIDPPVKRERIVIDFSSPNTAKEMHVGHLRSTIIGDSLARTFEFLGYDVLRLNHIGDWGTAFGMLIAYIKQEVPDVITGEKTIDLTQLVKFYQFAKKRFDENPEFKRQSQLEVVALQSGDSKTLKAWGIICEISRKAYQEIYDLLDVKLNERGESFYNSMLADTVKDLEAKGLVTISEGAKCLFLEGFQNREGKSLPLMIQKSDGGYNYDTTDMAALRQRINEEKADRIIIITDAGQSQHFHMIFKAGELAGYYDPKKVRLDHVPFGLVLGPDGKKFRTRSGDTEKLIDLILAAIDQAKNILNERSPEMDPQERDALAHALGIAAIKYSDLSCNRTGDYVFSYDRMLKFEGNTAAFLMYSYVRISGIKRKVGVDIDHLKKTSQINLEHPAEIALSLHLAQFGEALDQVTRELLPNRLTDYLYGLAEKFNAFFRDCRVEGSPQQNSRLLLCEAVARTMRQGLNILGVQTVEKM